MRIIDLGNKICCTHEGRNLVLSDRKEIGLTLHHEQQELRANGIGPIWQWSIFAFGLGFFFGYLNDFIFFPYWWHKASHLSLSVHTLFGTWAPFFLNLNFKLRNFIFLFNMNSLYLNLIVNIWFRNWLWEFYLYGFEMTN